MTINHVLLTTALCLALLLPICTSIKVSARKQGRVRILTNHDNGVDIIVGNTSSSSTLAPVLPTAVDQFDPDAEFGPPAGSHGDPHIYTSNNLKYDCQGTGHFVLSRSLDSTFQIQVRFSRRFSSYTLNQGFVVDVPGAPTVQISIQSGLGSLVSVVNGVRLVYYVNRVSRTIANGSGSSSVSVTVSGRKVIVFYRDIGVYVECVPGFFNRVAYLSDIRVRLSRRFVATNTLVGLLGTFKGTAFTDWTNRLGQVLPPPRNRNERLGRVAYEYSVRNWCLSSTETRFFYETGTSFTTFDGCSQLFPAVPLPAVPQNIGAICGLNDACQVDGVFGGVVAAQAAITLVREVAELRAATSPLVLSPASVRVFVTTNVAVSINVSARPATLLRGLTSFALYRINPNTGARIQLIRELSFAGNGIYRTVFSITARTIGAEESFACIPRFGQTLVESSPLTVLSLGGLLITG